MDMGEVFKVGIHWCCESEWESSPSHPQALRDLEHLLKATFLSLSTVDIWDQVILCENCSLSCRMGNTSWPYPLDVYWSSTSYNQKKKMWIDAATSELVNFFLLLMLVLSLYWAGFALLSFFAYLGPLAGHTQHHSLQLHRFSHPSEMPQIIYSPGVAGAQVGVSQMHWACVK